MSSWVYPENLGMDIAFDETGAEEYAAARDELANKVLELGGTVSYCVGVGLRFSHLMRKEHGSAFDVMKAIKHALDPNDIMNPGGLGL
jgi:FAD/FMN-containing dehydrogenase